MQKEKKEKKDPYVTHILGKVKEHQKSCEAQLLGVNKLKSRAMAEMTKGHLTSWIKLQWSDMQQKTPGQTKRAGSASGP